MKKCMLIIYLVSLLMLCSCNKTQDINKEPNKTADVKKEPYKTEDINKEPNIIEDNTKNFTETSRPTLTEKTYSFKDSNSLIKKDLGKIQLLGFVEDNYYFVLPDDENYNYYIANKNEKSLKLLYKYPCSNDIFFQQVYNGGLLVGSGYWEDNICHYKLISVNANGEERVIYEEDTVGFPIASLAGNHVVIIYVGVSNSIENNEESVLATIDLEDNTYNKVLSTKFTRDNTIYNGTIIMYSGGWKDGFCYELVEMANESIEEDEAGKCSIYYYSFKDGKTEKLIDYPHKLLYIRGDSDCFITSDYLLVSEENSGKITVKENDTYTSYDVPGVISAYDIDESFKLSEKDFIVYNSDYFWIFNLENKTYYKEKYEFLNEDPNNYYFLSLVAYDRQFAYLEPNDTEVIVHTFTLEEVAN